MNRSIIIVLAALFLAGCAANYDLSGRIGELPKTDNPSESGKVVVVRTSNPIAFIVNYTIILDLWDLFYIKSGEYTEFLVPPGDHSIAVKCKGDRGIEIDSTKFVASAGAVNYFKVRPNLNPCARIIPVSADEANALLRSKKFIDLSKPASSN
jgi:hypothetical protein